MNEIFREPNTKYTIPIILRDNKNKHFIFMFPSVSLKYTRPRPSSLYLPFYHMELKFYNHVRKGKLLIIVSIIYLI